MKKLLFILVMFTFTANVYAGHGEDSVFVANLLQSYERQRPRLERAVKRAFKEVDKKDSLYLIPEIYFKSKCMRKWSWPALEYDYEQNAELLKWENYDISTFFIQDFLLFKPSGEVFSCYCDVFKLWKKRRLLVRKPDIDSGNLSYDEDIIEYMRKLYRDEYSFPRDKHGLIHRFKVIH